MRTRCALCLLMIAALLCLPAHDAVGQDELAPDPAGENAPVDERADAPADEPGDIPFASQTEQEARLLDILLLAENWHYRCFGLLRLERFMGDQVGQHILTMLGDPHWQVRCFAIRAAVRKGVAIPEGSFDAEEEPRVLRMAQRAGVAVPVEVVERYAEREMRSNVPERVILGIEVAAYSGDEALQRAAMRKTGQLLANMNNTIHVTIGDRLAAMLGLPAAPASVEQWRAYLQANRGNLAFPEFEPTTDAVLAEPIAPIALFDPMEFTSAINYLDTLHEQDMEIAVVIDGTGSMGHVIQRAQAQTNRLMLILNDLAKSMRMGVIIYRDRADRPTTEFHRLDDDIMAVRRFLFQVEAKGGGDFPEAVYDGLSEVYGLGWSREANKQIVIVADAPAHENTMRDIQGQVTEMGRNGIPVHTLVVGEHAQTVECLEQIAQWGRGRSVTLEAAQDLGKTVMHFAIEPTMHESFDHFYDLYVKLCM